MPYQGDGIDTPFEMAGTTWWLDVALVDTEGNLIVAECKRWKDKIKQEHLRSFAFKIEELRKKMGVLVAGIYFARSDYQKGALRVAEAMGIQLVTCDQNQPFPQFAISYRSYDVEREKRRNSGFVNIARTLNLSGTLSIKVIRADGTIEEPDLNA